MISLIDRALLAISRALLALSAAACAGILGLVLAAVVMRYAVAAPFRFTEELSGLLLSAMAFCALPSAMAGNSNIRVTLITERLAPMPRRIFWIVGQAIMIAFCAIFAWEAWGIAEFTMRLNLMSEQARLPLGPWVSLMPAMLALTGFIAGWVALRPPPDDKPQHL
jgi:TRAP-type C4-dicarboxylate transport system permease small subunit